MKKLSILTTFLLICVFIITGCGGEETTTAPATTTAAPATTTAAPATTTAAPATTTAAPTTGPQYGGTLKLARDYAPSSLKVGFPPLQSEGSTLLCYETLIRQYRTGEMEPWLATSWDIADDLSSITLTLRQDVKFNDGSEFNAEAVKWNFEQHMAHKRAGTESWTSVDVIDNYTVRLNLSQYSNVLLSQLAGARGLMESKVAYETHGEDWLVEHPQGTGPFKYVSYELGTKTTYVKNENYWGKDEQGNQLPYLDGIDTYHIVDQMTRLAAVLAGDVDVPYGAASVTYKDLQAAGYDIICWHASPISLFPSSVNPESPWANRLVREAMEYAIDREALAKIADGGFGSPAYQLVASFNAAYNPDLPERRYSVAKAKELLELAGYANGFTTDLCPFPVMSPDVSVAVQDYATEAGITINIKQVDFGAYTEMAQVTGWEGLMMSPIGGSLNCARDFQSDLGPPTADLTYHYSVKRPDGLYYLVDQALATREMETDKVQAIIKLLYDDVTVIPLWFGGNAYAVPDYVHDMGWISQGKELYWTPEKGWMSKK
jgi:peptide/nickel transport system substrate-binding protein